MIIVVSTDEGPLSWDGDRHTWGETETGSLVIRERNAVEDPEDGPEVARFPAGRWRRVLDPATLAGAGAGGPAAPAPGRTWTVMEPPAALTPQTTGWGTGTEADLPDRQPIGSGFAPGGPIGPYIPAAGEDTYRAGQWFGTDTPTGPQHPGPRT